MKGGKDKVNQEKTRTYNVIVMVILIIIFAFLSGLATSYNILIIIIGAFFGFSLGYSLFKIPKLGMRERELLILIIFVIASGSIGRIFVKIIFYDVLFGTFGALVGYIIIKLVRKKRRK